MDPHISNPEMQNLANKFLLAIKTRNWELLKLSITRDCFWSWPGDGPFAGTTIGADAVISRISEMVNRMLEMQLNKIMYGNDGMALSLHFHTTMSGMDAEKDFVTVFYLRGYQISKVSTFLP